MSKSETYRRWIVIQDECYRVSLRHAEVLRRWEDAYDLFCTDPTEKHAAIVNSWAHKASELDNALKTLRKVMEVIRPSTRYPQTSRVFSGPEVLDNASIKICKEKE
jgi:hypothetical protein